MENRICQRIRDPLHDLIEFSSSELERTLWRVLRTRPFQRLRRIKQLGFSELVYPGACHSRFAHSIGVFHTARQLMKIIKAQVQEDHQHKENTALAAALVHDLGHGPFSHAFEAVGKRLGLKLADHETVSDMLIRNSDITGELNQEFGNSFADEVADIINESGKMTIYHAVVSSQFDADRLDYMRRDRLMCGTQHSAIDFTWLLANLEVGSVETGVDDITVGNVDTFVLGPKAIHAAEAYVLGLFQLYPTVYFHKATRGAEKLFTELLVRIVELVQNGKSKKYIESIGLQKNHPISRFAANPDDIKAVLDLDDTVVLGALSQMAEATDPLVKSFAQRLRDRKLYKCVDIRREVLSQLDPKNEEEKEIVKNVDKCCASIKDKLTENVNQLKNDIPPILIDDATRSPYKSDGESKGPLDQINIRTSSGNLIDLKKQSSVVSALKPFKLVRAYIDRDDPDAQDTVAKIITGEIKKWQ